MKMQVNQDRQKTRAIEVDYPISDNLQENVQSHGEDVVNKLFVAKAKTEVQDRVRAMMKQGKTDKEIHDALKQFKLGQRQVSKKTTKDKARELYNKMPEEERKEFLKELKS